MWLTIILSLVGCVTNVQQVPVDISKLKGVWSVVGDDRANMCRTDRRVIQFSLLHWSIYIAKYDICIFDRVLLAS